jgi:CDP-6-deoxy-D-xylo-4-hexulose-3-dehydrase
MSSVKKSKLLRDELTLHLGEASRINTSKTSQYWYPLAMATYGVDEVLEALDSMCNYRTTMWDKTRQFENDFGSKFGGEAVMVNSGSSADLIAAFAMHELSGGNLKNGDEVLVPAVTWPTQIWSIVMAGFTPKFVDVNPRTLNIDINDLRKKVSSKTKAISIVHLMGNTPNMAEVELICEEYGLEMLEDCCESLGTKWNGRPVGTFGQSGTFSFFFSHHMTTMEGGMLITTNPELAERYRLLRAHGWSRNLRNPIDPVDGLDPRYTFVNWGFNVRPTELQAGFGQVQLTHIDEFQQHRLNNALLLTKLLEKYSSYFSIMQIEPGATCSWFALPIMVSQEAPFSRDQLTAFLESTGVETRPIVAGNLARHPAVLRFPTLRNQVLPGADMVHEHGFYIGIHPVEMETEICRLDTEISQFLNEMNIQI